VRPLSVVLLAPGIDRGLRVLNAGERAVHVEQFLLQRLVQSLDLPRRGRGPSKTFVLPTRVHGWLATVAILFVLAALAGIVMNIPLFMVR
jgi:hypothetical protein